DNEINDNYFTTFENRADKASFVIDMVRKKGERASSQMIALLCEEDPFLSENLGLMRKHN
uniref:CARD domain-containing protein n=1 Tax=Myripristis murdjan TaxID=586833 RepID=A0A667Z8W3_9TELE